MIAGLHIKADYLATRNVKDTQPALLTVIQPAELLTLLS
jgi:hypothetical protein